MATNRSAPARCPLPGIWRFRGGILVCVDLARVPRACDSHLFLDTRRVAAAWAGAALPADHGGHDQIQAQARLLGSQTDVATSISDPASA